MTAAPSHLLFYGLTASLLQEAYEALSVPQRDSIHQEMRACSAVSPRSTVLPSFEPEWMGGTTLSMSDSSVFLSIKPTVINTVTERAASTERLVAAQCSLVSLRGFANSFVYAPSLASCGEQAAQNEADCFGASKAGRDSFAEH